MRCVDMCRGNVDMLRCRHCVKCWSREIYLLLVSRLAVKRITCLILHKMKTKENLIRLLNLL